MSIAAFMLKLILALAQFGVAQATLLGASDDLMMSAGPGDQHNLENAAITFSGDVLERAAQFGVPPHEIMREIRQGRRVRWVVPDPVTSNHLQVFVKYSDGRFKTKHVVNFTLVNGDVDVYEIRPFTEDDDWAWRWSNYQTFEGRDGQIKLSYVALGRDGALGARPIPRMLIEKAFDALVGPPVPNHQFANLKTAVGRVSKGRYLKFIFLDAPERRNVRVFRADEAPPSQVSLFRDLAHTAHVIDEPTLPPGVDLIPNFRLKVAWKHGLPWPEFLEASRELLTLVPNEALGEDDQTPFGWSYYVKQLNSGKAVAVIVAPSPQGPKIVTAFRASIGKCEAYLDALGRAR